jgi:hypothetical protein
MERRVLKGFTLATTLAALSLTASVSPAGAAVTLGQITGTPGAPCFSAIDRVQTSTTAGATYVVPSTGGVNDWTLTSWSHNAGAGDGQQLEMKMFRKVADPSTYQVVGHDGPRPLTPSVVNTFPVSIRVRPGDVLGSNALSPTPNLCRFATGDPGDAYLFRDGDIADGESQPFTNTSTSLRLNISAEVSPTSAFTLGAVTRNKKKGTATVTATVPNPGELSGSGKGVKAAAAGATISKAVTPGGAQLLIKAKGKKKRKLNETGKVKLNVAVTYTPTGGGPSTQSVKVKLKKKL